MIHNFLLVNICILPTKEPVLANSTSKTHPSSGKCSRRDTGRVEGAVLGGTRQGLTRNSKPSVGRTLGAHRRTSRRATLRSEGSDSGGLARRCNRRRVSQMWVVEAAKVGLAKSLRIGTGKSLPLSVTPLLLPRRRKKRGEQGRRTKFFPSPLG